MAGGSGEHQGPERHRGGGRGGDIVVDRDQALVKPVKQGDQLGIVPSRT